MPEPHEIDYKLEDLKAAHHIRVAKMPSEPAMPESQAPQGSLRCGGVVRAPIFNARNPKT